MFDSAITLTTGLLMLFGVSASSFLLWLGKRPSLKPGMSALVFVLLTLVLFVSATAVPSVGIARPIDRYLLSLLFGFALLTLVISGLAFARFWRPDLFGVGGHLLDRHELREQFTSILKQDFLSALNESLPRGADDHEHGMDYIPYLLQAIRTRRERFRRSARMFLALTICLGTISAGTVGFFGWIIVHDDSVGAPRTLRSVRESLSRIAEASRFLATNWRTTEEFQRLEKAIRSTPGRGNATSQAEIVKYLAASGDSRHALTELAIELQVFQKKLSDKDQRESAYKREAGIAIDDFLSWRSDSLIFIASMEESGRELAGLLPLLERDIGKDEARIAEILRRLVIGVVVVTFFVALLRFFGQLYKRDYDQVLRAELDDLAVRSFYVSYTAAGGDSAQRASVTAAFVSAMSPGKLEGEPKSPGVTKQLGKEELDAIKEVLNAFAKRL